MSGNRFGTPQTIPGLARPGPIARHSARIVLIGCLGIGLAMVVWRTKMRTDDFQMRAGAEAASVASALESQFSQAASAAQALSLWVRQAQGVTTDFPAVAAELLTSFPGLAHVDLQPGGIVRAIAPWQGNERAVGFNAFKDPARVPGANLAIQRRAPVVAGPLRLYRGEPGFAAMAPVVLKSRDGRESFWGLAVASVRSADALDRAHFDDLANKGYDFSLFAGPTPQGRIVIAEHGNVAVGAVRRTVRASNAEFGLALRPQGGWIDRTEMALELLGVVIVSGSLSLLVSVWKKDRTVRAESASLARQLASEAEARKQAREELERMQEQTEAVQAELTQMRVSLQQAETQAAELKLGLRHAEEKVKQANSTADARLSEMAARAGELERQLDARIRASHEAAKLHQKELDQARAALEQTQKSVAGLEARLETAARAEKESSVSSHTRLQQAQATIAGLRAELEAAQHSARQEAGSSANRIHQEETKNRELAARLAEAQACNETLAKQLHDAEEALAQQRRAPVPMEPAAGNVTEAPPPEDANSGSPQVEPEPPEAGSPSAEPQPKRHSSRSGKAKKSDSDQMDLFVQESAAKETDLPAEIGAPHRTVQEDSVESATDIGPEPDGIKTLEEVVAEQTPEDAQPEGLKRIVPSHRPAAPVNLPELRKAAHEMLPLLTDQDPGAKDCLKANRLVFRSAFSPDAYAEFEQLVRGGEYSAALEHFKKAIKKHGI